MIDFSNTPISGGLVFGLIGYAAISAFITGPIIGERTIKKSNWDQQCKAIIQTQLEADRPLPEFTPKMDCNSILGLFGTQGRQVCRQYGNPELKLPMLDQLREFQQRKNTFQAKRLSLAVSQAGSRCDCAISLTLEKRRMPLAIYAGTARLVTPPPIKNISSELLSALNSPQCTQNR